jgi:hypothetical protein
MTCIISEELRYARTKFLLSLAEQGNGKVTPDAFLKAVNGSQKLILNILWIARRSGYVSVEQVREGRKIAYWDIKLIGEIPTAPAVEVSPLDVKRGAKIKSVKQPKVKAEKKEKVASAVKKQPKKAVADVAKKSDEDIRAANLARMKSVSANIAKKVAAKKRKIINIDDVEKTFGTSGEIATSFAIDNGFDSMEGINVADFLR